MSLLVTILSHSVFDVTLRVGGLSLLAAAVTTVVSFVYRSRVGEKLPEGASVILGLGAVAIYLNTRLVLVRFLGEGGDPLTVAEAVLNVSVFVAAGIATYGGRATGDRLAQSDRVGWGRFQPDFSPIVRAAGRSISVTLPGDVSDIEDIEGYDPVQSETKEALAGQKLDFPRGLTLAELTSQLTERLREKHDVGYVDVELATDGSVEYLAVGRRAAGIGPTLPPQSAAVAVRADPPLSASPGDSVQLWRTDGPDGPERVGTGELRAAVGPVATVVTDESVADRVDPTVSHRLVTLSADSRPDREFAAMLRRGDETMSIVEVTAESPLVGSSVGSLAVTVVAIRSNGGDVETIPKRDRVVADGDSLFAIGRPEDLRKLEAAPGTRLTAGGTPEEAAGVALSLEAAEDERAEREARERSERDSRADTED